MLQCERYFSQLKQDIKIPNGENSRNRASNVVLKFHDDPTVNESEIVVFLRQVRWPAGKREGFGRREKNEIVRQRRLRSQSEN